MKEKESIMSRRHAVATIALTLMIKGAFAQYALPIEVSSWDYLANVKHVSQVNNLTNYVRGITGKHVTVAVIDGGFYANPEIMANVKFATDVSGNGNVTNSHSASSRHGTHVAGIIAANINTGNAIGIAPDANLALIRAFNNTGTVSQTALLAAAQYSATQTNARITNLSLGATVPFGESAMRTLVNDGQLVVVAAGNNGGENPTWPARYAKETWANKQIIVVGAVDSNNKLASFSNKAGDTRMFYVVAPGVSIYSTATATSDTWMSGTSMAAPIVSGIAANVMGAWPWLKADTVAHIITRSADRLGAGTLLVPDAVYGWGLVNAEKAMKPSGTLQVKALNGTLSPAMATTLVTNLLRPVTPKMMIDAVDDYGRNFGVAAANLTRQVQVNELGAMFSQMDQTMTMVETTQGNNYMQHSFAGNRGYSVMSFNGGEMTFGYNQDPITYFSVGSQYSSNTIARVSHMSYVNNKSFVGGARTFDGYKIKMGFSTGENQSGSLGSIEYAYKRGMVAVTVGQTNESKAAMGTKGSGAFAVSDSTTTFGMVTGTYNVDRNTNLVGSFSVGSTAYSGKGLITSSEAITAGWAVAAVRGKLFNDRDSAVVSISQPLQPVSGSLNLSVPRMNSEGNLEYDSHKVAMNTVRQTDLELGYSVKLDKMTKVQANVVHKMNYQGSEQNVTVAGVRFLKLF